MREGMRRWLAFGDLAGYRVAALRQDLVASATVTVLSVPQGVAYAMIAGLPPAMGLYAACVPTIVGSLFRSSRHVVTGPTNALSLLIGTAGAATAGLDPVPTALLLTFLVGALSFGAGLLRLGVLIDFISLPVVMGYITGAGVSIGVGQLHHLSGTPAIEGNLFARVARWAGDLGEANLVAVAVGVATLAVILALRRWDPRVPGAMIALAIASLLSWLLDARAVGLRRIADLGGVPTGPPPLTLPGEAWSFEGAVAILPIAGAATVLSLVESSSVARALAARTGQRLELSTELVGQGLANLAASLFGGYVVSGSPGRSALNLQIGAVSRLAGAFGGGLVLAVLLFLGPAIDHTPLAALAGLLLVVAWDLMDRARILKILRARRSDAFAFVATLIGTFVLRLDQAVYLGVLVSLVSYLRRSRMLAVHPVVFDDEGRLLELALDDARSASLACSKIRLLNVEGELFFGAAGELAVALDDAAAHRDVEAIVLRLRRARGLDVTTIEVLEAAAARLAREGRHLFVVGLGAQVTELLDRTGATEQLGRDHVYRSTLAWFEAADAALARALEVVGDHRCASPCPVRRHLQAAAPPAGDRA